MPRPVYFISDAHLGSSADPREDEARLARLVPFLRHAGDRSAERLYILGDLFDFWFEYTHVMPWRHAPILAEIRRLVDRGVPVTMLGGNHDWWGGPVFRELAGMTLRTDAFSVEHQGVRAYLAHGDGLASDTDRGYLLLKSLLRNRWLIRCLRVVHPDLAYALGWRLSRFSRRFLTKRQFAVDPPLIRFVDDKLLEGHDAFLMGHLHARHQERRPVGGTLFILGDWMKLFCALRLEGGEFHWEDWSGGELVEVGSAEGTVGGGHAD
jgi:UDP-2,3-diacylglucosamine hydrolase